MDGKGTLFLVATPIGNLEDITARALRTLNEADIIAAEDTRQTLKLLNYFKIKKPLVSYYEHKKIEKGNYLLKMLLEGKNIALVTDAGTPGISDPGEDMVKMAVENGIKVTLIPGASAVIAGIVLSGLPSGRFIFEGFLPMNKKQRRGRLAELKGEKRTLVFYEAPHKLKYTLADLYNVLGERKITIARELTKKFEEVIRCNLSEAIEKYSQESPRGEFVLVLQGDVQPENSACPGNIEENFDLDKHFESYINMGMDRKSAVKKLAEERGVSKREVYNRLIREKQE